MIIIQLRDHWLSLTANINKILNVPIKYRKSALSLIREKSLLQWPTFKTMNKHFWLIIYFILQHNIQTMVSVITCFGYDIDQTCWSIYLENLSRFKRFNVLTLKHIFNQLRNFSSLTRRRKRNYRSVNVSTLEIYVKIESITLGSRFRCFFWC